MTNQEAIEQLKSAKLDFKAETIVNGQDMNSATLIKYSMNIDAIELAIAALEKQEPMKVTDDDMEYGVFTCPACGAMITTMSDFDDHKFCLECGQALDWKDGGAE